MSRDRPRLARVVTVVALAMSLFHLWVAYAGPPNAFTLRAAHFGFALALAFLTLPVAGRRRAFGPLDWALLAGALAAAAYPIVNLAYFNTRMAYVGPVSLTDQAFAILMIAVVLEATRRAIGPILPLTAVAFLAYQLIATDTAILRLLEYQYMTTDALFGIPAQVSATYVVLFVIFGALAERFGLGRLFMDFALALTGHQAGGPAKVAVVTSGLFGSVSGSAVANVMTTGTFTIPLMKRIGYPAHFAGAVKSVASTGGQIMPPIMGAAAFVMAEFLGVGYLQVAAYALLPALLYYLAVFLAVHFEARLQGLRGLPRADLPRVGTVLRERGHLFLPLVIIIGTLMSGFSAPYSALMGILSVVPVVLMRRTTRGEFSLGRLVEGLEAGAINSVIVALACASAGIVIGVIAQTGLGLAFTGLVRAAAQDMLLPALVLTMIAGIVLGMGMPTTPAYIVQVALLVPALVRLEVPVAAAHMFVFYFAILSAITPPVAIAVYAACGISRSAVWATSVAAVKLGLTGYVIPFMFVFGPSLLMIGTWERIALTAVTAAAGVTLLAGGLSGYLLRPASMPARLLFVAAAFTLIKPGLWTDLAGLTLAAAGIALNLRGPATPVPVAPTGPVEAPPRPARSRRHRRRPSSPRTTRRRPEPRAARAESRHGDRGRGLRHVVAPPHRFPARDLDVPAAHVGVVVERHALPLEARHPGPDGDVGDRVVPGDERLPPEPAVEHAVEPHGLLGEALLRVGGLAGVEVREVVRLAQHRPEAPHLPHQPLDHAQPPRPVGRHQPPRRLREVDQDRARLHQREPRLPVPDRGDLVVGRDREEVRRELLVLRDVDGVRLVGQPQLLQRDGDLAAVGRRPGVEVDHGVSFRAEYGGPRPATSTPLRGSGRRPGHAGRARPAEAGGAARRPHRRGVRVLSRRLVSLVATPGSRRISVSTRSSASSVSVPISTTRSHLPCVVWTASTSGQPVRRPISRSAPRPSTATITSPRTGAGAASPRSRTVKPSTSPRSTSRSIRARTVARATPSAAARPASGARPSRRSSATSRRSRSSIWAPPPSEPAAPPPIRSIWAVRPGAPPRQKRPRARRTDMAADCILIGAPVDCGKRRRGCLMGPDALRVAGLAEALADLGHGVRDAGNVAPDPCAHPGREGVHALPETVGWTAALARAGRAAMAEGLPIFLGGDHALSLGSVAGVAAHAAEIGRPLFVLWLDAHSDAHTPATTASGNLHGTPVGHLLGRDGFDGFAPFPAPVPPERVHLLGLRSVDPEERAWLESAEIGLTDMRAIDEGGIVRPLRAFLDRVAAAGGLLHVSLDVDFLDPAEAPAVGTTVPGGATLREAHLTMELLHDSRLVASLDLVELNPMLDERGRTARLMVDLTASLMGRRVFDRPTPSHP